jgi:sterol desaturase/sphingolipid hydroxylase (fatty acid hydroxylase superfamily)
MIDAVWGMYNHSNINIKTGWLLYVFNGPELHRWHHDLDAPRRGVNLSTKFALWDWLFGTAYYPSDRKAGNYGLDETIRFPYGNYFKEFTFAFRTSKREASASQAAESCSRPQTLLYE